MQTVHAMTVHKSQGSQAREVSVIMPPEDSRLLTRELFYTAVTRAQDKVRVIGTEAVGPRRRRPQGAARVAGSRAACRTALERPERYFSSDSASVIWANSSSGALATRWCRL